ncbi:rhodanese-like domain-containing protein [Accumulibacter sp.]|jgi:rhodanese-related sulfurtransferase|uniref:rhodanese-like domain-containing protein n=1 Tax=Accumulibacter sp. TaxID=2053492 RepID=UPI001AD16194|nr:rhodanese-like domain-containing protein [Accumulibacter sp.]MBN8454430.1 sulfurtransferase [Accumulibacter sp.]
MKPIIRKRSLAAVALACSLGLWSSAFAADWAPGSTDWDRLPEIKRSRMALYLTPQQAHETKKKDPKGVAFFDIRTRVEAVYVGMPTDVDALVPYVEHQEMMTDWDEKRHMYKLEPNQDFIPELERRLNEKGLTRNSPIILICRSGDRSAKAADRLLDAGYTKVYSVAEGVEGDTAKGGPTDGQRVVNGWKNARLPWTYRLDKAKMYFPH